VVAALRGVGLAVLLTAAAISLHRTTDATWLVASGLAATLATLAWRGGALRRGAFAGVLAGIPVFIAPALYFLFTQGHCPDCHVTPSLTCMVVCMGTSSVAGVLVGNAATRDASPRGFAAGAVATALLTGLLGCGTTGIAGAVGVVLGLVAGGVTGWVTADRAARA
jgi:hypothetical protein